MKEQMTGKNTGFLESEEGFNGRYTAIPKQSEVAEDADLNAGNIDYGEMNEADARESGYTRADGKAAERAKPDVEGNPTGAFTDLGHGRSSVVKKH
jgi:hypothetical protein